MNCLAFAFTAALAVGAVSNQADAAKKTMTFDGLCNVVTLTSQPSLLNVWAYRETERFGCTTEFGVGTVAKTTLNNETGRWASFSIGSDSTPGLAGILAVQFPFKTGGHWLFYQSADGKSAKLLSSGTYTIGPITAVHDRQAPDFRHAAH